MKRLLRAIEFLRTLTLRQITGLAGALLLAMGLFSPLVRVPLMGRVSFMDILIMKRVAYEKGLVFLAAGVGLLLLAALVRGRGSQR
jgi:hypothetical protein